MTEPKIQQYDDVHGNRWLNRDDYRTLSLSSLGGALEFYDFVIYVFYAKIISEMFFPSDFKPVLGHAQYLRYFCSRVFLQAFRVAW